MYFLLTVLTGYLLALTVLVLWSIPVFKAWKQSYLTYAVVKPWVRLHPCWDDLSHRKAMRAHTRADILKALLFATLPILNAFVLFKAAFDGGFLLTQRFSARWAQFRSKDYPMQDLQAWLREPLYKN